MARHRTLTVSLRLMESALCASAYTRANNVGVLVESLGTIFAVFPRSGAKKGATHPPSHVSRRRNNHAAPVRVTSPMKDNNFVTCIQEAIKTSSFAGGVAPENADL
jgi:hypothetical protein